MTKTWFEKLSGFKEQHPDQVRENFELRGDRLVSKVNGAELVFGEFEVPSLEDLRRRTEGMSLQGTLRISEVTGDVKNLHQDPENHGALFQAASQFNVLEMVGPEIVPEMGVGIYEHDPTQGPACAVSCGAGTIFRNYFAPVNGKIGQSADNQLDCLEDIGRILGNHNSALWTMRNGYALPSEEGLKTISRMIRSIKREEYDRLKSALRIGLQWNTAVTLGESSNIVSQAYCSALPVAYSSVRDHLFEDFARLVLEGLYEATLHAGLLNYARTGNSRVHLTLVGGGAFGNPSEWIFDSIRPAVERFRKTPLDVRFVTYSGSNQRTRRFISSFEGA
jgi:hypothetical protein